MNKKKFGLGFYPTPLHKLENLSAQFEDYTIYIKRDDQTGLASGGNKTRKLEYLIQDALDGGYNTVFTAGAQQSNHCRQTAAACAKAGVECHLILRGDEPKEYQGNLLLSKLLGAIIHFTGNSENEIKFNDYVKELPNSRKSYLIPYGGSNEIGAIGYVKAIKELKQQLTEQDLNIDYIFFASGSGGTQAGLTLGLDLYELNAQLMPINLDKDEANANTLEEYILDIINKTKTKLGISKEYSVDQLKTIQEYNEANYGILTENEKIAIDKLAKEEGILLDPVYTGRAFFGMLAMLNKKILKKGSSILFWHTGGYPALFDYYKGLQ
ncbi:MAG: D-cysteine desulfhydrase [Bacteroidetes bacterium]|nr:D-cysteine desulfhydrase [Bacteroidota bacterium]